MSPKQELHQYIDGLSEDEASMWMPLLDELRAGRPIPLTGEQMAAIKRGIADLKAGRVVTHQEALRRLGIER